jgi:Cytochrome P460
MPAASQKGIFPSFKAVAVLTAIVLITLFAIVPFVIAFLTATRTAAQQTGAGANEASPIFGVTIPQGYRQWELIAPAEEAAPLDELRAILGNRSAIDAYRSGTLPFPDGTVLVKLAWKHIQCKRDFPRTLTPAVLTDGLFSIWLVRQWRLCGS